MASVPRVDVIFYTKEGYDESRLGACPFCQRIHMILNAKAAAELLCFQVITINVSRPPTEFRQMGLRHVPAILVGHEAIDSVDDIVAFLELHYPSPDLYYDPYIDSACKDFFSRFCYYIKEISKDDSHLSTALKVLDNYLSTIGTGLYLAADHLTHIDCEVLPKLQHVRVATKKFKGYNIPQEFSALWRYLHTAYGNSSFKESCPCDQEIILHWSEKPETSKLSLDEKNKLSNDHPRYSFDVPALAVPVQIQ